MCKTYSYFSVFIAENQRFEGVLTVVRGGAVTHNDIAERGAMVLADVIKENQVLQVTRVTRVTHDA